MLALEAALAALRMADGLGEDSEGDESLFFAICAVLSLCLLLDALSNCCDSESSWRTGNVRFVQSASWALRSLSSIEFSRDDA